ncbi:MAG TPA: radical SAM protein [Vicinamibacteria bacterium]|jgi:organic radical activating enzyme|nr:radical SAM protein [Vicinamibacteria bacterium]
MPSEVLPLQSPFETYQSIYWVFTQLCNDNCAHCYNDSSPRGQTIPLEDGLAIVDNLPGRLGRLILSGGEPLTEEKKLHALLEAVARKYGGQTQVMLQTNGDLLTGEKLDALLARGVTRIDVASIDRFHKHAGARRAELEALFQSRGMSGDDPRPLISKRTYLKHEGSSYGFWGATEDLWLGGNWARGEALRQDVWLQDGTHNFCAILSGARGFLGGTELPQELSIQLFKISPCCPGTLYPLGDARQERVSAVLDRIAASPIWKKLNEGDAYGVGESLGVSGEYGRKRALALKNVCLWCDEFMARFLEPGTLRPRNPPGPEPRPRVVLPVRPA